MKRNLSSYIYDPEERFSLRRFPVYYIDGLEWEMADTISYRMADGRVSTIQKSFIFDFATIPRILWSKYPPTGDGDPYGVAAAWHDWLYVHKAIEGKEIDKKTADLLFLEIMLYMKVDEHKAKLFYRAVRRFGGHAWRT